MTKLTPTHPGRLAHAAQLRWPARKALQGRPAVRPGILAGTQSLLADDFGGNTKLRSYLSGGNNFVFRNPNKSEQYTVAGLKIAHSMLPEGGGYALATGTGRVSQLRVAWARDLSPWTVDLPTVELDRDSRIVIERCLRMSSAGDPVSLYAEAVSRLVDCDS